MHNGAALSSARPPLASAHSSQHTAQASAGGEHTIASQQARASRARISDTSARQATHAQQGDVEAPLIARERNRRRRHEQADEHARGVGTQPQQRQSATPTQPAPTTEAESSWVQERERARVMVERGNVAITAGDFEEAAAQFQKAHDLLEKVEGPTSAAVHKTQALASAMARKAAQDRKFAQTAYAAAAASAAAAAAGDEGEGGKGSEDVAESGHGGMVDGDAAGNDKEAWQSVNKAMTRKTPMPRRSMSSPPDEPPSQHHHPPTTPAPARKEGEEVMPEDEDHSFVHMSHSWQNAPPPPPEARTTDLPPRDGEDPDRAAARKWLAHRHDCTVICNGIMRKFAAKEVFWAANPDQAPKHRTTESGTLPPDMVLYYHTFNATDMRLALDSPLLDYSWVLAHQQDEADTRKEEEEEEEEAAAQLAREEAAARARAAAARGEMIAPDIKYASQLANLQDMGFPDTRANLEALIETGGSVENAISRLTDL